MWADSRLYSDTVGWGQVNRWDPSMGVDLLSLFMCFAYYFKDFLHVYKYNYFDSIIKTVYIAKQKLKTKQIKSIM